jgi:hypothetical protein
MILVSRCQKSSYQNLVRQLQYSWPLPIKIWNLVRQLQYSWPLPIKIWNLFRQLQYSWPLPIKSWNLAFENAENWVKIRLLYYSSLIVSVRLFQVSMLVFTGCSQQYRQPIRMCFTITFHQTCLSVSEFTLIFMRWNKIFALIGLIDWC